MQVSVLPSRDLQPHQVSRWLELLDDRPGMDNPFLRPELVQLAATVLPDVEVAILSARGEECGYFAFERQSGDVAVPVTRFLSDFHAVVCADDLPWTADELIRGCGLKAWKFDHLLAHQRPFRKYHSFVDDSFFMDLSGGFDAWAEQRRAAGSSVVKQSARKQRKLEREVGPLRFEAHTQDPAAWQALARWKAEQLLRLGYADMFRLPWVNDLLAELRTMETTGCAPMLSTLYAGDQLVAVHLGLRSPTVVSSWIPTFDHEYAKYSPGTILQLEITRWAAANGICRIDLCRGENQMKRSLASGTFDVAVGSVDHRLLHRTLTRSYYGLRNLVHASPVRDVSLKAVRRLKALAGR